MTTTERTVLAIAALILIAVGAVSYALINHWRESSAAKQRAHDNEVYMSGAVATVKAIADETYRLNPVILEAGKNRTVVCYPINAT